MENQTIPVRTSPKAAIKDLSKGGLTSRTKNIGILFFNYTQKEVFDSLQNDSRVSSENNDKYQQ
ncbi:hypothetical protein FDZ73_17505 [bacterium]|nr:MAG: hypothetical protein FDZ73_17505 [bacterium]